MQITSAGNTSAAVVGQWVIAAYAGRPYVARVINVDTDDGETHHLPAGEWGQRALPLAKGAG